MYHIDNTNAEGSVGIKLWFWWLVATVTGGTIGVLTSWIISNLPVDFQVDFQSVVAAEFIWVAVSSTVVGAAIGTLQAIVLRQYSVGQLWWIVLSAIGWSSAGLTSFFVFNGLQVSRYIPNNEVASTLVTLVLGVIGGCLIGMLQSLALSGRPIKASWWVLANVLGQVVGAIGYFILLELPSALSLLTSVFPFVAIGAIQGATLIWLTRQRIIDLKAGQSDPVSL